MKSGNGGRRDQRFLKHCLSARDLPHVKLPQCRPHLLLIFGQTKLEDAVGPLVGVLQEGRPPASCFPRRQGAEQVSRRPPWWVENNPYHIVCRQAGRVGERGSGGGREWEGYQGVGFLLCHLN